MDRRAYVNSSDMSSGTHVIQDIISRRNDAKPDWNTVCVDGDVERKRPWLERGERSSTAFDERSSALFADLSESEAWLSHD